DDGGRPCGLRRPARPWVRPAGAADPGAHPPLRGRPEARPARQQRKAGIPRRPGAGAADRGVALRALPGGAGGRSRQAARGAGGARHADPHRRGARPRRRAAGAAIGGAGGVARAGQCARRCHGGAARRPLPRWRAASGARPGAPGMGGANGRRSAPAHVGQEPVAGIHPRARARPAGIPPGLDDRPFAPAGLRRRGERGGAGGRGDGGVEARGRAARGRGLARATGAGQVGAGM
ncbi:MAG: Ribonuclease III, partial [uncultured Craurococcus sp.]